MHYLVGISGGLDSTLAAANLLDSGHTVTGAFLRFSSATDSSSARKAAEELHVPLHEVDCTELFDKTVKTYFATSYAQGKTPNPCVVCNRHVKIALLCDLAKSLGCDKVVTGHYADIQKTQSGRYAVVRAADHRKDQSYMLWGLTQKQLALLDFPLKNEDKNVLRQKAVLRNFSSAVSKESMDVCFLPDGNYAKFVESVVGKSTPGNFVDKNGKILGKHKGIIHYTVGQRKGLGIALGQPAFVSKIDPVQNTVTLVFAGEEYSTDMTVSNLNFQSLDKTDCFESDTLLVKIRYAAEPVRCRITVDGDLARVTFDSPARAVTPGQSAVFYDENGMIAFGGFIEKAN